MKKYETVEQWVKDEILEKRLLPGDKLPTESSLCQLLEVSRNSVREALHRLAQDGWIERRKGVGAICIQKLETYARDVGIVCYYTDRYIWPRIIQGCDRRSPAG